MKKPAVDPGLYEHHRGGLYRVIQVVQISSDEYRGGLVIFRHVRQAVRFLALPVDEFLRPVTLTGGRQRPRFTRMPER